MAIAIPSPLPDVSATVSGKVNLVAQVLGAGPKTIDQVITPIVSNTNGTSGTDIVLKIGTSVAAASLHANSKLLSLRTSLGGTEVEKLYVGPYGNLVFPQIENNSCIVAASNTTTAIVGNGGNGGGGGVKGFGYGGIGVEGESQTLGVYGHSAFGHGVKGQVSGAGGIGVWGTAAGANSPGVKGESTNYFGIIADNHAGTWAGLQIVPRATLPGVGFVEDGGVAILTDGSFNWYSGGWKSALTSATLSGYAPLAGASFTGEVSFPYAKFNPGSAPGTPAEGQVYYDSTDDVLRFRNASTWVDCGGTGSVPDASATTAGKVNLIAQELGAGVKTITDGLVTPIVSNTNGTGASDLVMQIGTSIADGSVNTSAKLLSLRTGIGGTPVEKLFILKSGSLTSASSLAMLSDPSAPVSASGGIAWRSNAGVAELSSNGAAYATLSSLLTVDTPAALTSSSNHIAISLTSNRHFYHTMIENTTLDAPSGVAAGMKGCIDFYQHASSAKTLAFNTFWKFSAGVVPALPTATGSKNLLAWYVGHDTSYATCRLIPAVA